MNPRISWLAVMLLMAGFARADPGEAPAPLLRVDFDQPDDKIAARIIAHPRVTLSSEGGVGGSKGARVAYVGSDRGSRRVVMRFVLPEAVNEATLVYDVLFERDFQFVKGGKLHGLGPADPAVGGERVTPGTWSARLMFGEAGALRTYNYHQHLRGRYGEGRTAQGFAFVKDRFYRVAYHVRLNDPPTARNGFARVYVDGVKVAEDSGLRFRAEGGAHTLIRHFMFSTFHGGSDRRYAPTSAGGELVTVHARFDNFTVYPGRRVPPPPARK